jgi:hypothetical protein
MAPGASSPHAAGPGARSSEGAQPASRSSAGSSPSAGAAHRCAAPPRQDTGRETGEGDWSAQPGTPATLAQRGSPRASGVPTPRPWTSTRSPTPQPARRTSHHQRHDERPSPVHAGSCGLYGAAYRASLEVVSFDTHSLSVGPDLPTRRSERPWARQLEQRQRTVVDLDHACAILGGLPDLSRSLAEADPELRRQIYERFQFSVELDRNKPEVRMKALVSTAFMEANDLEDLAAVMVADKSIAGAGLRHLPATQSTAPRRIKERWYLQAGS